MNGAGFWSVALGMRTNTEGNYQFSSQENKDSTYDSFQFIAIEMIHIWWLEVQHKQKSTLTLCGLISMGLSITDSGESETRGQGTVTALMMLVCPEPGLQPVTTITISPVLKKPRALPAERQKLTHTYTLTHTHTCSSLTLTDVHCKCHAVVHIIGPDLSGRSWEQGGENAAEQLWLTGHLNITCHGDDRTARTVSR